MFCIHCGKPVQEGQKFCAHCGKPITPSEPVQPPKAPVSQEQATAPSKKKNKAIIGVAAVALVIVIGFFIGSGLGGDKDGSPAISHASQSGGVETMARPQLVDFSAVETVSVTPAVATEVPSPGLSNITNANSYQFYLNEEQVALLEENQFFVTDTYYHEFFELYESNRYAMVPNFVTVDSLMHTYHLYFSLLLNRTEKNYLSDDLLGLSQAMLTASMEQYDALVGTPWEEAACRNVAFFAVAAALQDASVTPPAYAADLVAQELEAIYAEAGVIPSPISLAYVDYTQFKPRGYYEGDETLEQYFRAMMWYGQINFAQKEDTLNRSALLMTMAMEQAGFQVWEKIYTVTSFFAGVSDDLGYYEYAPAIQSAFGAMPTADQLADSEDAYQDYVALISQMRPPAVNSVPVMQGTENIPEETKGFRFMGQRFTIDAAVMQQLVYSNIKENSAGEKRMLPDTLDMPAALGSDVALQLLEDQGATDFSGYSDNMEKLRETLAAAPESSWSTSLYSSWLYTLEPLLEPKGEGYPSFMTSTEWAKKDLETYAGSFTELKHDTVLYGKQVMAEMGGGEMEVLDDRGYVQPEVQVYSRFQALAQQTADGLEAMGYIDSADVENLSRLAQLADQLLTISVKELQNETLTDDEYELIRAYGGTLEHFWLEAVEDKTDSPYPEPTEIPASLVTDIATDPNGTVLQVATGTPAQIVVVVPVDGQLRLASGSVFNFYQFEYPMSQRLTDSEWRYLSGEWQSMDGPYTPGADIEKPWWTQSYWYEYDYTY
ncbi:MAG: DUF3160 domain-containing protein [Ruminiclostridium sp.]|nr:DUF3160 domain-containing protein [Ruminiclostridium sp.]